MRGGAALSLSELTSECVMFSVYAVACASLAIIGSSLSILLLWLAGAYLYIRRRRLAPHFVSVLAGLTMLICKSCCSS